MNNNITTVPNQKVIEINKEPCKGKIFAMNNMEALDYAARVLQTKAGFKLWSFLSKNQDKYTFALSSQLFMEWSGVGYTAYTTAIKELEDNGFLSCKNKDSNIYIFYEMPKELKQVIPDIIIENPPEVVKERIEYIF